MIPFPMSNEIVLQFWFRCIFLPPAPKDMLKLQHSNRENPEAASYATLKQFENFREVHRGFNMLQDLFLGLRVSCTPDCAVSVQWRSPELADPPDQQRPNTNSLLALFLDRSLSAVSITQPTVGIDRNQFAKFQEILLAAEAGKSHALAMVCKILAFSRQNEEIRTDYLARFYIQLVHVLQNPDPYLVKQVLPSLLGVVQQHFPGFSYVFPHLLKKLMSLGTEISAGQHDTDRLSYLLLLGSCAPYAEGNAAHVDDLRTLLYRYLHSDDIHVHHVILTMNLLLRLCIDQMGEAKKNPDALFAEIDKLATELLDGLLGRWAQSNTVCLAVIDALNTICHLLCIMPPSGVQYRHLVNQIVKHLCYLIEEDLRKPPMAHSRDLHSVISHAYVALSRFVVADRQLTTDKVILKKLLSVVELGVCGVPPKDNSPTSPRSAGPKPASRRVKDAAEQLLIAIFAESVDCSGGELACRNLTEEQGFKYKFGAETRFFAVDSAVIYAVRQTSDFAADLVTWSAAGRSQWKLELKVKRDKEAVEQPKVAKKVDLPKVTPRPVPPNFPNEVDKFPTCKADYSVPPLKLTPAANKLRGILQESIKEEEWLNARREPFSSLSARPPAPVEKADILRTFLLNFTKSGENIFSRISFLDPKGPDFKTALERLDEMPVKIEINSAIFYVKQGQSNLQEIAKNGENLLSETCGLFIQFLAHLAPIPDGSGIVPRSKGSPKTLVWSDWLLDLKFSIPDPSQVVLKQQTAPTMVVNGQTGRDRTMSSPKDLPPVMSLSVYPSGRSSEEGMPVPPPRLRSLTQDMLTKDQPFEHRRRTVLGGPSSVGQGGQKSPAEPRHTVMLVWLEAWDDLDAFPAQEAAVALLESQYGPGANYGPEKSRLSASSLALDDSLVHVVFLAPVSSHLLRAKLVRYPQSKAQEVEYALLLSTYGGVYTLPTMCHVVRETVSAIGWRKRLDMESWLLPHVRRKMALQDLTNQSGEEDLSTRDRICKLLFG